MAFHQISRNDGSNVKEIDKECKNKFKWSWLEDKDANRMFLSEWVRKVNVGGKALCLLCNDLLKYGGEGKSALTRHAKNINHVKNMNSIKNNSTLPSSLTLAKDGTLCGMPYGAAPNIHDDAHCSARTEEKLPKMISFQDRLSYNEAFLVSFLAEHNLPFTMAPNLIEFARFMAKDAKVLEKMSRHSTSYKLREGLAPIVSEDLVHSLRSSYFSINVDECFSNNHQKIFSILVSYFSEEKGEVMVQHYKSKSFQTVNAQNLCNFVLSSFAEDEIPLVNLISCLSDSTNYMRGKTAGFETLLRDAAPHLLDIDGDVCHHAHNSTKKFLKPFGKRLEKLCTDLHTDMLYSTDLRGYLVEICEMLSVHYHMPPNYVPHRWLSILDAADVNAVLLPALTALYYSWVSKDVISVYKEDVDSVLQNCSDRSRSRVRTIQKLCMKKKLTSAGLERKKRIVEELFYHRVVIDLHFSFYCHLLPLIKSFVLVFEQKEPMVHKLFSELKDCMKSFLGCFMKVESISSLTAKQLSKVQVTNTALHKPFLEWNLGWKTSKLLKKVNEDDKKAFKLSVQKAFTVAAKYMQEKFPLNNQVLKYLSSIGPNCHGVSVAVSAMKKLPSFFTNVIKEEEMDNFDDEVDRFHLVEDVPSCFQANDGKTPKRIDEWWAEVLNANDFPHLAKVVKAALSIFTGPMIEQSFSGMNNIINSTTNRLHTETFDAIQTVKYDLLASKEKSTTRYHRRNYLKSPINPKLCRKMQSSFSVYDKKLKECRKRKNQRFKEMSIQPVPKKQKVSIHERAAEAKCKIFNSLKKK